MQPAATTVRQRVARLPLDVIIVGAGIGGLAAASTIRAAGHRVHILEAASELREAGAGMQLAPNATRILQRWGLSDQLQQVGVEPQALVFRRYANGETVGRTEWRNSMRERYAAPYYHVHRQDLHRILHGRATGSGVTLSTNSAVSAVTPASASVDGKPKVVLANGDTISADIVVGADGIRSLVRSYVTGQSDRAVPTGDAAYRAVIDTDAMRRTTDRELIDLIDRRETTVWMGPQKHLVGYNVSAQRRYNLVLIHPDQGYSESWTTPGDVRRLRAEYQGWEPRVQKLLELIKDAWVWRLNLRDPIPTWVDSDAHVTLLGDARGPMLPYMAQGGVMAIEDAAVLGRLLSHVAHAEDIPRLLRGYQQIRQGRVSKVQLASSANRTLFHIPDGPAQEARDAKMREAWKAATKAEQGAQQNGGKADHQHLERDAERGRIDEILKHDADAEADGWLAANGFD
uniref:FAD-binding domain-containing protein n=2 Tax=Schizophyllum commune (strain H4-8 / FGSC 9210) TaxID=578458 RepID=D8Q5K5_SCHCM